MAGAGIVVRNSIILVDFIEQRLGEGMPLAEAVIRSPTCSLVPLCRLISREKDGSLNY
jgi:multidrug efflux pump subunit AcrB